MGKETIYKFFKNKGLSDYAVIGLMANIQAESGFKSNNLQNTGNSKLKMTDEEYTKAVDNGTYSREKFIRDGQGYGLVQHTFYTRKGALFDYIKTKGEVEKRKVSIGDEEGQCEFIYNELQRYKKSWNALCNSTDIAEITRVIMTDYEKPADQSEKAIAKRVAFAEQLYKEFCTKKNFYCVQVGAFEKKANAEKLVRELETKGFRGFIVEKTV